MRAGVGGVGPGRGAERRRPFQTGRNMAVNQVIAANFYGNRGRAIGAGQAAYFNDPDPGKEAERAKGAGEKRAIRGGVER